VLSCSTVHSPAIAKNVLPPFVTALDLFRGTAHRDAQKISALCTDKWFSRGARIFREGEPADAVYVLRRGMVKLSSVSDKGRETILHILKPDEVFGELLLSEEQRPFTAVTLEDSLVTIISKQAFVELLSAVPTIALNFIQLLSKRLTLVETGLADFGHTWSHHRLARVLVRLSEKYGEEVPQGTLINVPLTHEDLANLIGTSRETVTTQLGKFKRLGFLKREARRFIVAKSKLADFIRSEELRSKNPTPP
jgi:CRP/FNR family cyclic AMP-dependent transcriptional regulator